MRLLTWQLDDLPGPTLGYKSAILPVTLISIVVYLSFHLGDMAWVSRDTAIVCACACLTLNTSDTDVRNETMSVCVM